MAKMAGRRKCVGLEVTEVAKFKTGVRAIRSLLTSYDTPILFSEGVDYRRCI
jgi:hypothetical protein